jgi:hypothetical protein
MTVDGDDVKLVDVVLLGRMMFVEPEILAEKVKSLCESKPCQPGVFTCEEFSQVHVVGDPVVIFERFHVFLNLRPEYISRFGT